MKKKKVGRPKIKDWCWTCGTDIEGIPIKKDNKLFCSKECADDWT